MIGVALAVVVIGPLVWVTHGPIRRLGKARKSAKTELDVISVTTNSKGELKKAALVATVPVQTYSYTDIAGGAGSALGEAIGRARSWVSSWRKKRSK